MDDELRVGDERWRAIVEQARRQGNAKNLPRPAGLEEECGGQAGYALQKTRLVDGRLGCYLMFSRRDRSTVHIGSFVLDGYGETGPQLRKRKRPAGALTAGRVIALACGRSVRVEVDERGLPYPVPVEMARPSTPSTPSTNGARMHECRRAEAEEERVEFF